MSQDQTQEQSAAGLNEPGSVLHVEEDDFDILKAGYEELSARYATLLNERDVLKAELEKLQLAIKQLIRARYGRKSERVDPEQLQLALEGLEQEVGAVAAREEAEAPADPRARTRRSATAATCRPIWSATRSSSTSPTRPARAAAARCT